MGGVAGLTPIADLMHVQGLRQRAAAPATAGEVNEALSFALRFNGRKRRHDAVDFLTKICAKRLVEHLERSEFWF